MSGSVEINQESRPEYQIEQISPRSYLLKFGRGGEVWARVETTGLQSTSSILAGRNEALILTKLENIFSVAIDVNQPLTGDEIRKNFLEALSEYATR